MNAVISPVTMLLAIATGTLSLHSHGQDNPLPAGYVEAIGLGTVDTTKATNRIQAKLLAKRAAIVDAQRNLLEQIEGVRVTSGTTVKDAQLESDLIANRVKGLLQGAFIIEESVTEDAGEYLAEVKMGVCMNGGADKCGARPTLAQILYPTLPKAESADRFEAPANPEVGATTGLIVDATGIDFQPLFDVRLVTTQGKEIYGPGHFDVGSGGDWLHWAKSLDGAMQKTDVIGPTPLLVKATEMAGDAKVVLSNDDAVRVFQANLENNDFLRKGKVVFVVR